MPDHRPLLLLLLALIAGLTSCNRRTPEEPVVDSTSHEHTKVVDIRIPKPGDLFIYTEYTINPHVDSTHYDSVAIALTVVPGSGVVRGKDSVIRCVRSQNSYIDTAYFHYEASGAFAEVDNTLGLWFTYPLDSTEVFSRTIDVPGLNESHTITTYKIQLEGKDSLIVATRVLPTLRYKKIEEEVLKNFTGESIQYTKTSTVWLAPSLGVPVKRVDSYTYTTTTYGKIVTTQMDSYIIK